MKAKVNMDYKERLEKAKELYPTANADQRYVLECLFPELAESEGERTRKEILNVFKQLGKDTTICGRNYDYTKWIAWLEKQGETSDQIHYWTEEEIEPIISDYLKMNDAGYEWDAEKKEVKKIHVIDEGKAEMDYCFTKMMNGEKVSPAWSEEDEVKVNRIVSWLENLNVADNDILLKDVDWLKSLKERVQPQWKPKDIHLEALSCVINGNNLDVIALKDLLEQLKRL